MDRYHVKEKIGEGSFGRVFLGIKRSTGEKFAIKRTRGFVTFETMVQMRELQMLMQMSRHKHIVSMEEIIFWDNIDEDDNDPFTTPRAYEFARAFLVFEYLPDGSLHDWIEQHKETREDDVRDVLKQILLGLQHCHAHDVTHRDLKPENVLRIGRTWKIADFSLARRVIRNRRSSVGSSLSPMMTMMTVLPQDGSEIMSSYVSTRWYRAPEVILMIPYYGTAIDIHALGCIAAELYLQHPVFPGTSEIDQLHRILAIAGTAPWVEREMANHAMQAPSPSKLSAIPNPMERLQKLIPKASPLAIDLIRLMIHIEPDQRLTCSKALAHGFFINKPVQQPNEMDFRWKQRNGGKITTNPYSSSKRQPRAPLEEHSVSRRNNNNDDDNNKVVVPESILVPKHNHHKRFAAEVSPPPVTRNPYAKGYGKKARRDNE